MKKMTAETMCNAKDAARAAIDALPDDATWEDVADAIVLRQKIDRGLMEVAEGHCIEDEEVWGRLKERLRGRGA